jgi:hypothetical protein
VRTASCPERSYLIWFGFGIPPLREVLRIYAFSVDRGQWSAFILRYFFTLAGVWGGDLPATFDCAGSLRSLPLAVLLADPPMGRRFRHKAWRDLAIVRFKAAAWRALASNPTHA